MLNRQSQTVSIARPLDFYCLEDGKEELVTAAIDLDSYVDVMQKCGELVSGLALVVTPSYFVKLLCSVPCPKKTNCSHSHPRVLELGPEGTQTEKWLCGGRVEIYRRYWRD